MLGRFLVGLACAGTVLGAVGVDPAFAQQGLPFCSSPFSAVSVAAPARLSFGRAATVELSADYAPSNAVFRVRRSSDKATVFARPLTPKETAAIASDSDGLSLPLGKLPRGAPPLDVEIAYETQDTPSMNSCATVAGQKVTPAPGRLPRLRLDPLYLRHSEDIRFVLRVPFACEQLPPGPVGFSLQRGKRRFTYLTKDYCGSTVADERGRAPAGLNLQQNEDEELGRLDEMTLRVGTTGKRSFRRRYRFRVFAGDLSLRDGWLVVKRRYVKGYRVYEGRDAFINYCINSNRPTYSSGGRLYCDSPPDSTSSYKFARR